MLDLVWVALFQVAAGGPQAGPSTAENAPAAAQTEQQTQTAQAQIAESNREVCRVERVVGSRLRTRVCMSEREAAMLEQEAEDFLQDAMRISQNGN